MVFSHFKWDHKAIEKLLGTGIDSEYLNNDKIGKVMDNYSNPILFVAKILLFFRK